jgi:hypothetical protein
MKTRITIQQQKKALDEIALSFVGTKVSVLFGEMPHSKRNGILVAFDGERAALKMELGGVQFISHVALVQPSGDYSSQK